MIEPRFVNIKTVETPGKGKLSFFEGIHDIPFEIKRVYYITGVPQNMERGAHAHHELDQLLICPNGEIEITLDNGQERADVILSSPDKGLLVEKMIWHDMKWLKKESILLVVASDYYDENDYIRSYDEFISICKMENKE